MMQRDLDAPNWWASLAHGGMLIAPARIAEFFPDVPAPLSPSLSDRLRRDLLRVQSDGRSHIAELLDTVLEDVLGLKRSWWTKGSEVDAHWSHKTLTGEVVKPRRVWHAIASDPTGTQSSADNFVLPLFVADRPAGGGRTGDGERLGVGRGLRPVSRVTEWLRRSGLPMALLTNGRQWRLLHAGADYDAWCEWDTDLWFEEGSPSAQVTALRTLLSPAALQPARAGDRSPLVAAILDSRRGQAELSSALGERVRLAVEKLIQESAQSLAAIDGNRPEDASRREMYIAATRIVMRCVVILFAEARDLLPRDNSIYYGCYGIQGLREQLARIAGGHPERLRHSRSAWPRLLALFELIRRGSAHEALPIPAYGGGLFDPGDRAARDGVLRALAAIEDPANALSDSCVHQILELLSVSPVKVRQGRSSTLVNAPVDFSDLSSEYIGILYEGLLDFELRRAPDDDAVIFLRIGDEPALPLSRLEDEMAPNRLAELIGKLKKRTKKLTVVESDNEEENDEDEETAHAEDELEGTLEDETEPAESEIQGEADDRELEAANHVDIARSVREHAQIWAEKAVKEAKLVPYPRDDSDPEVRERWSRNVAARAHRLYRMILPGQWYLVRWGGTRKGAGTFYTRPQLAVPTVRRTLQPLLYAMAAECIDPSTGLPTVTERSPRTPEEILALKVCDPAMGSGSFLVSALRYITDALVESLHAYGRLHARPDGAIVKLADGLPLEDPSQETIPLPLNHPEFDERLRARLKRHVVERCIYGVDLDPLAVELARMALWIETMDRRLPFGFLDHKLRCGNALVGTWFDRFQDYPVMAFDRDDAGDKNHERYVHHYREYKTQRGKKKGEMIRSGDVWTHAWKQMKNDVIKPGMREWITARGPQYRLDILGDGVTPERVHDDALAVFQALHELPVHAVAEGARLYSQKILGNPAIERLRMAFDTWCAIWFWPGDALEHVPTPSQLLDPPREAREIVARVREEQRFFHWELEFPDVFTGPRSGFHAIVGNPPWETQQPNSKEFFSNIDPLYRTYGKQVALEAQSRYFEQNASIEHAWLTYAAYFKSFATWSRFAAHPFGDPQGRETRFAFSRSTRDNAALHDAWRAQRAPRAGYADTEHPFRHQGDGKPYTYKMFVEAARALLHEDGYLGFITPSGVYTDKGSTELRRLLLDRSRWEWLFGFENRQKLFDIDSRFKFNPIIVRKGGRTVAIRTAFMHQAVEDWQEAERYQLAYPRERVAQFSPRSSAILEIRSERDLAVLKKMYRNSVLLGEDGPNGWGIIYRQGDFNMTSDSKLFPPRAEWEARGYRPNEYGMWIGPNGNVALPLYQGVMIYNLLPNAATYDSGAGHRAKWVDVGDPMNPIEPQFLIASSSWRQHAGAGDTRIVFRSLSNATNERTIVATLLGGSPCGNSLGILQLGSAPERDFAFGAAVMASLAYDWSMRLRIAGTNINAFFLWETGWPKASAPTRDLLCLPAARLAYPGYRYARQWISLRQSLRLSHPCREYFAATPHERLRLHCTLDAVVAHLYGLNEDDVRAILRECDHPVALVGSDKFARELDPKGFWRVDKEQDPELRHTVLTQIAFQDLERLGLEKFFAQNDGEGWMIPETLRLADYGLGHDDRAKEPQPVASRLGLRFLPWQLEQGVEESWGECARHAERIKALLAGSLPTTSAVKEEAAPPCTAGPSDLFGRALPTNLFGEPTTPVKRRQR
jgi:hypothetical protein